MQWLSCWCVLILYWHRRNIYHVHMYILALVSHSRCRIVCTALSYHPQLLSYHCFLFTPNAVQFCYPLTHPTIHSSRCSYSDVLNETCSPAYSPLSTLSNTLPYLNLTYL